MRSRSGSRTAIGPARIASLDEEGPGSTLSRMELGAPDGLPPRGTRTTGRRRPGRPRLSAARLLATAALAAALLALAPAAQGRTAANLSLVVNFLASGSITVTLPDGTPVGVASGSPTVIPAGFYTVQEIGPGGCTNLPYFDLRGPGESIVDNMDEGELAAATINANFQPNSTYTWRNDNLNPPVVYTFVTSSVIEGTAPLPPAATGITAGSHSSATSTDVVGSGLAPLRGALAAAVSAAGKLSLAAGGKSVTTLTAGRYTITVNDRSRKSGFMLESAKHATLSITGVAFVGKRSTTVDLTAGRWYLTPSPSAKKTASIVVG